MAAGRFVVAGLVEPPQAGPKKQFEGPWKIDWNGNGYKAIA